MSARGAKRRLAVPPPARSADVESASSVTQESPACVCWPEALSPTTLNIAEHGQLLTLRPALGPCGVHNVQQGFNSVSVSHRLAISRVLADVCMAGSMDRTERRRGNTVSGPT